MVQTTAKPVLRQWYRPLALILLGAITALGQAPFGIWAATLIGVTGIIWILAASHRLRDAVLGGWAAGFGYFVVGLHWIIFPFLVDPERHGWMAPFALILMGLGGGLFWAFPAGLGWVLGWSRASRAAAFAAAMMLSEWLREWIFTGFPWAMLGHVWIDTPVAQLAATIGTLGLSGLTLLLSLPLILVGRRAWLGAPITLALLSGAWLVGEARLGTTLPPDTDIHLRLVQPNAAQALKWDPDWSAAFWDRLLSLSAAPSDPPIAAVIWPETAVNFLLNHAGEAPQIIGEAAGVPVLMGIQRSDGLRYFNSLAEIGADGEIGALYDKFHLVPFGEYTPWGNALAQFGIRAFAAQAGFGYSSGLGPRVLTPAGLPPVQPLICYEAIFPQHIRDVDTRPAWLLQVTNDAWFGNYAGPWQHLAQARFRAIESGLPMMRAANTGISASIDPYGQIRASLPLNVAGKLDVALPAPLPPTFWMGVGNGPMVFVIALMIGGMGLARYGKSQFRLT